MLMLIDRLMVTTNLEGFSADSCYKVLSIDIEDHTIRFLVVDDNQKFRILDNTECEFFTCQSEENDDDDDDDKCEGCSGCGTDN